MTFNSRGNRNTMIRRRNTFLPKPRPIADAEKCTDCGGKATQETIESDHRANRCSSCESDAWYDQRYGDDN